MLKGSQGDTFKMRRTSAALGARLALAMHSLALIFGASPALAASLPEDLAEAVHAYDRAQFANDVATLDRLVVDDFLLVNSNASVEDKTQFLADFHLPGFKIEPY